VKVLLFDIDGTLMLSGGAGLRAMNEAFYRVFGVRDALLHINLAGRTDTSILLDALNETGVAWDQQQFDYYKTVYYDLLIKEIETPGNGKALMPGVGDLLPLLAKRNDVYLGLLTGNWETSGRIKISHFKLNDYFRFGAFADDSGVREELLPFAVRRFSTLYNLQPKPEQVYVIGDTPSDIKCAKPHGAIAVAVAASSYSLEQLQQHEPDYLFADLSDTERILQVLG